MTQQVQPIFILPENAQRTYGRSAQHNNIAAAKAVADTVRTTLGPKGMDKMLVSNLGDVVVTNDGVTILEEMNIEHPTAKMIVEIAKTQENEVGDGTTTAVVIAGELLHKAEALIEQDVHPTVVAKGYRMASEKALQILRELSFEIKETDEASLHRIATTAMTGKGAEHAKEHLSTLAVKAVKSVMEKAEGKIIVDKDNIKIEKKVGGSVEDSELVEGIILDKEKVHPSMPDSVKNAKVALIDCAVEVKSTETDAKIQITEPNQMQGFLDMEEKIIREKVEKIAASGANVIFCQKGIDDLAQHFLAKKGIFAVRRVSQSDIEKLARATGGKIVSNLHDISADDLGKAGLVEAKRVGDEEMTFVRECRNAKAVTILIRGGTEHVVDEIKRAVEDSIGDLEAALTVGKVVAGAGATETELALQLRKYGQGLSGREQLAVNAFAEAIEVIPRTLAENSGLDPIDLMTELKAAHDRGEKTAGVDVFAGKAQDAWKAGIIEPLKVKLQAVSSASEVAIMVLRIDDVIAAGKQDSGPKMPPMPNGGGMPDY
ncbi:TCP-1/cpn60 chaperonin family protein [Candidatus Woesearchaeota archaeon]|nr:TCP-1/cpn60 chaperonin family protein [Candidatus Woesearchaeota archaeon]